MARPQCFELNCGTSIFNALLRPPIGCLGALDRSILLLTAVNLGGDHRVGVTHDIAIVQGYIRFFEEAFLLSKARMYDVKGRKYIGTPYKLYFEDISMRKARLNSGQIEETHIMENILYNKLRFRGFNVDVGIVNVNEKTERNDKNGHPTLQRP